MHPSHEGGLRKRVLLMSYAFSPFGGSEEGSGWNRALQSAKRYDTWMIVCNTPGFDGAIEELVVDIPGLNVVHVPPTRLEQRLNRSRLTLQFGYNLWQRRVFPIAMELHRQHRFDLVHHVTYNMFREPGYAWKLDTPFVWGPIGGTQNFPWQFLRKASFVGALGEFTRNCLNTFQLYTSPRFHKAGRKAASLIAANSTGQRDIKRHLGRESVLMSDTGCSEICSCPRDHSNESLRIMWSGVVTTRKALYLLIEALAQLPSEVKYELHVVGEGSDRTRCEKLARRLGVDQHIQWLGWLSHKDAKQHFMWANVFAFTSLRDTTGTVISEALSYGVPVICLDHQGVRDIVTSDCGVKIPVGRPQETVARLTQAITKLAHDRVTLNNMSDAARERAKCFLWDELGNQMAEVYANVRGDCPVQEPVEETLRVES